MNAAPTIEDVVSSFQHRGFEFVGTSGDGWFRLVGELQPSSSSQAHPCEIQVDPTFFELPRVRLLKMPRDLPSVLPHLAADGSLCYIAKGTVVLDIFDPVGQSLACLERAAHVLEKILRGEMIEDLTEEFFAYWNGPLCFLDIQGTGLGEQKCIVAEANGSPLRFITDDESRTNAKLEALGYKPTDRTTLTFRVRTCAQPRPMTTDWPPKSLSDILRWQGTLDHRCRKKILERVREGERRRAAGCLIVVESPLMTYAFLVVYDRESRGPQGEISTGDQVLFSLRATPLWVVRIDDRYLAQRNIPNSATLADRRIVLVGCGTIGGYAADMLARAGAGTGAGVFTLVDSDILLPQNIGRHRLGFPDLLSNKAEALARDVKRLAPGSNVRALPVDVRKAKLGDIDLLIDATGEEPLGHWLSAHIGRPTPLLSVWIAGPGTAVRALLRSNSEGACYRCLCNANRKGDLSVTVEALPLLMAGHGCEGLYVPFPASVSVRAAALAVEMALDWANGTTSPSLRTQLIDRKHELATPDQDPLRDQDCPICS